MKRLERYMFRQAAGAFLMCLGALVALVWVTQALRRLDIVTSQGETIWAFLAMTALWIPQLIVIMAPIALFVAVVWTLNRLNADSELIVMAASGVGSWRIARPFVALALIVTVVCGYISIDMMPASLRTMRVLIAKVYGDMVSAMARSGTFTELGNGLTLHVRERAPDGSLLGLLVSDQRDPKEPATYIAEVARVVELVNGNFLVMQDGTVQRRRPQRPEEVTFVAFDAYALDMSHFMPKDEVVFFGPRERSTSELLFPDTKDPTFAPLQHKIRSELHERLAAPLYALPFVLIALASLARARTNRQSRLLAMAGTVAGVGVVRLLGFAAISMIGRAEAAVLFVYAIPLGATAAAAFVIVAGDRFRLPSGIAGLLPALARRLNLPAGLGPAPGGVAP